MKKEDALLALKHLQKVQETILSSVGKPHVTWQNDVPWVEGVVPIKLEHIVNGDVESYYDMLSDALVQSPLLQEISDRPIGVTEDFELLVLVSGNAEALEKEDLERIMVTDKEDQEKRKPIEHPYTHRWVAEHRVNEDMNTEPVGGFETDDLDELETGMVGSLTSNSGCIRLLDRYGPDRWLYSPADVAYVMEALNAEPKKS